MRVLQTFTYFLIALAATANAAKLNFSGRSIDNTLYSKFLCRSKEDEFKALVPGSCSQYYQCKSGVSILKQCPKFYDPVSQQCVETSTCVETSEPETPVDCTGPCCGALSKFVVSPTNPAVYYECKNNAVVCRRTCPSGKHYNLALTRCDTPSTCNGPSCTPPPCTTTTCTPPPCTTTTTCTPPPCTTTTTTCSTTTTSTTTCSTTTCSTTTCTTTTCSTTTCSTTTCSTTTCSTTTCSTTTCSTTTCSTTTCSTTTCSTTTCSTTTCSTTTCSTTTCPTTTCSTTTCSTTTCSTTTCSTTTCSTTTCSTTTCLTTTCSTTTCPTTTCSTTTCSTTTCSTTTCSTTTCSTTTCTTTTCSTTSCSTPEIRGLQQVVPQRVQVSPPVQVFDHEMYMKYVCLGKPSGFLMSSPRSCSEYYVCHHESALRLTCGDLYFNPLTGLCDLPSNTGCVQNI